MNDLAHNIFAAASGAAAPPLLRDVDIGALLRNPPASVLWWWDGYMPPGNVALLGGHGGGGKSTVGVGLGACIASGRDYLGKATKKGRVLFFSGEDPAELVAVRLARVCRLLNIDTAELRDSFRLIDATEDDPALFTERRIDATRTGVTTPTYAALVAYVQANEIDVVIVDNASDVYDADEINRALVRAFIRSLSSLVRARGGAVLLLAHVDKSTSRNSGAASTESYSGSTAWHNSVRSRLFLTEREPGLLELLHQKCNLGPKQPPLALEWPHDGIPQAVQATNPVVQRIADHNETRALLRLIGEFSDRSEWVSTATTGPGNAAIALRDCAGYPQKLRAGKALDLLRQAERRSLIERVSYVNSNRKPRERWGLTATGRELAGLAPVAPVPATDATSTTGNRPAPVAPVLAPRGVGGLESAEASGAEASP